MNKKLLILGFVTAVIWFVVTLITFGLPIEAFDLGNGFAYDTPNNDMPTVAFLVLFFLAFSLMLYAWRGISKTQREKHALKIIIGFAILFRVILLPGEMIHENDIYRYIWDGKVLQNGINPYKYAPLDVLMYHEGLMDDDEGFDDVIFDEDVEFVYEDPRELDQLNELREKNFTYFKRIGHREVPTIYPPFAQMMFAFISFWAGDSIVWMKFFFVVFDIGIIFLVIALLRHFQKDERLCLLYAWSPLVLKEIANAGHYDSVPVFFAIFGLFLFVKHRPMGLMMSLAFSTLAKFFAGVFVPVLARAIKVRHFLLFFAMLVFFYLPFLGMDRIEAGQIFAGLSTYGRDWSYNASIFVLVRAVFIEWIPAWAKSLVPAKIAVGGIYLVVLGFTILNPRGLGWLDLTLLHKCFIAVAALFILSPTGYPWYFIWVMPFLCLFPRRSWILLSGLLMLSYLNFHSDFAFLDYQFFHIPVLNWIIYVPFFVLLLLELKTRKRLNL